MMNLSLRNIFFLSLAVVLVADITYRRLKDEIYDDFIVEKQIFFTPLPSNYTKTQQNQVTRGIKIVQADDFSKIIQHNRQFKMMTRLFHIAAFYFQKTVKVEKIDRNQTKLMNPPTNIPLPNTEDTVDIEYLKIYQTQGFDTEKNDLIIFLKYHPHFYAFNRFIGGILQIQRRPIYGYLIYQFESGQPEQISPKTFVFHYRIQLVMHSIFHILGLSTQLFLENPLQSVQEIVIDPNYQTKYYKNASSNQFKKQSQVIDLHPNRTQIRLKSQEIRKALYDLFSCQDRVSKQDVRIGLATLLKNVTKENGTTVQLSILAFHFSNLYGLNRQIMQIMDAQKIYYFRAYKVNLKISTITLAALRDTGYYQEVLINQLTTDYIPKQSQKLKQPCQSSFFGQIFDSCTGQRLQPQPDCSWPKEQGTYKNYCSIDGEYSKWIYNFENSLMYSSSPICNCQAQDLTAPKCLRLENQAIINKAYQNQNCFDVLCVQQNGSFQLQVQKKEVKYYGCKGNQTRMNIDNFFVVCPPNKEIFCKNNLCNNMCSERGLCIRGTCLIPSKKINYPEIIARSSIAFNERYGYQGKKQNQVIIPYGCLVSNILVVDSISIVSCFLSQERYGLVTIDTPKINVRFTLAGICQYNCQSCRLTNKIDILDDTVGANFFRSYTCDECQAGQFIFVPINSTTKSCAKCQSLDCTQCLQQKYYGIGCTNCRLGHYISREKRCLPCTNLDNCVKCIAIKKDTVHKCLECSYGYQLLNNIQLQQKTVKKILNKCIKCLPNCGKCNESDIRICYTCFQGYYLQKKIPDSNINAQCKLCGFNCRICLNQKICQECYPLFQIAFFYQNENQCVKKCDFPCRTCRKNKPSNCTSCFDDYNYDGENEICKYNNRCNQKKNCTICQVGQGISIKTQPSFESKCMPCNSSNCLTCFGSSYSCIHCKPGFYIFFNKLQCRKCPNQCRTCYNSQSCQLCNDGYTKIFNIDGVVYQNSCLPCTHNCANCTGSPNQCLTCLDNYIKIGHSCFPKKNYLNYTIQIQLKQNFIEEKQYYNLLQEVQKIFKQNLNNLNVTHQIIDVIQDENLRLSAYIGSNENTINTEIQKQILQKLNYWIKLDGLKTNQTQAPKECLIEIYMSFLHENLKQELKTKNKINIITLNFTSKSIQSGNCSQYRIIPKDIHQVIIGVLIAVVVVLIIIIIIVALVCKRKYFRPQPAVIDQDASHPALPQAIDDQQ